jgi:glycosyltransferase involved in cell wall biosynthesis
VFLQFPPTPALYAVALYSWLTGANYVSDCHIGLTNQRWLNWLFAKKLLAKGEVIVHNAHLVQQVEEKIKTTPFVVRDGIAKKQINEANGENLLKKLGLSSRKYVLFPSSFDKDEPLQEVFDAARTLPEINFVMTWHAEKLAKHIKKTLPPNVLLTGFLEIDDFNQLFANAGVALVLTKNEGVQLSGMQEAMAFEIPAVVSDLNTSRFLYKDFPVYVKNNPVSIAKGIKHAFQNERELEEKIRKLRIESEKEFHAQMSNFRASLYP